MFQQVSNKRKLCLKLIVSIYKVKFINILLIIHTLYENIY